MSDPTLKLYTRRGNVSLHVCNSVRTDFNVGGMPEVGRSYHLGGDGKAHNIWTAGRALQEAPRDVFLSIIGNEMVVRARYLYRDRLVGGTVRSVWGLF